MKISICIPQYNRIKYLLRSLSIIEQQTYPDIEISISDDCSSDDTDAEIKKLMTTYRYPIVYDRNPVNLGYDRNYRKCIEMASGDYAVVIGNDDSIYKPDGIENLVKFLQQNNLPDIGFSNMIEERTGNTLIERALKTTVIGSGPDIATRHYSCFSFVGGLIYKRSTFIQFNTDKYDGSIYSQMYMGVYMISKGCILFSIYEPLVIKDLLIDGIFRKSYRERIAKKWSDYKVVDAGLPSVINVLIGGITDAGAATQKRVFYIFRRIYSITFPHWILDYKENGALPEAMGLIAGLNPKKNRNYSKLTFTNQLALYIIYLGAALMALITPVFFFKKYKHKLYAFFKK
ncbi:MAG: glycosyltransferase family 2 protein [Bacteroidetes bacterium]|nr:glycosyltransferase family 2 protein [Bacteroidota bacterium]